MKRRTTLQMAAAAAVASLAPTLHAQADFPSKPVRILVGYPPGGPLDSIARALAPRMSEELKQPVLVENRAGASGVIATDAVARSTPDGYTLVLNGITHAILPSLNPNLPYDTARDFTPIAIVGWGPLILAVNPAVQANSVRDLVALSKRSKIAYGSPGNGTSTHVAVEMFKRASGADLLHVPYKGSAAVITDVIGGSIQMVMDVSATALPQVRSGKLRALAVTGSKRHPELPDVPTISEAGYAGADVSTWWGILGPPRMPRAVVDRLNASMMKALQAPEVRTRFATLGGDPSGSTPEEFDRVLRQDLSRFATVVKEAGIKVD
ncbi:tripartite tricarboxylate transporter substrate binding protein [Ramlibacter sp.]|uniref:tripartite tricarboxylate transporter substrate binding protein n=1 Tax=Ramlibacter sp. TaxID=1917967 RepID=UPI003D0F96CA